MKTQRSQNVRHRKKSFSKADRIINKRVQEFYTTRVDRGPINQHIRRIPKQLHASTYLFSEESSKRYKKSKEKNNKK